ncbi:MAG: thermonuclease family protein [Desulfobulbaceae bacterium]|nr:thermonuclease family protein [Desulfobulbaceae bacterium]
MLAAVCWCCLLVNDLSYAARGCCSYHGGICGQKCCDGTELSQKCREGWLDRTLDVNRIKKTVKNKLVNLKLLAGYPKIPPTIFDDLEKEEKINDPPLPISVYSGCSASYVFDGDTIAVDCDGREFRVRLWGIDTPEKKQSFGQEATGYTGSLVLGKKLELEIKGSDRYGRSLAMVKANGQSVNEDIVAHGYAWVYRQYCNEEQICGRLMELEEQARKRGLGLWSDSHPVMPWQWRRLDRLVGEEK